MRVFGVDISGLPRYVQFLICSFLIFLFFIFYAYLLELIFRLEGFHSFGWYLTLIQFLCYSSFALLERSCTTLSCAGDDRKIPMVTYLQLAFFTVATMGLSNGAVGYLNYPTQVIFKSCKLIPVLIGGILIQGKQYGPLDVFAAGLMSLGLILFSLVDSTLSPNVHLKGYVMISLALIADAMIGNIQEKSMKAHHASNNEVLLYSYTIGSVFILCGTIFTGELFEAFEFCAKHPEKTYGYALVFSVTGYLGIGVVLTMVKNFGALAAVMVTNFRKVITILLSFLLFPKPFTTEYIYAGMVVMLGVYLNVYSSNREKWDASIFRFLKRKAERFPDFSDDKTQLV